MRCKYILEQFSRKRSRLPRQETLLVSCIVRIVIANRRRVGGFIDGMMCTVCMMCRYVVDTFTSL